MKKEFLLASMPRSILFVLIVCVGTVFGVMGYVMTKKQVEIEIPEVKTSDEIIEDEIADWQTYRNEEIGFEFEHPSNLKLTGVYNQKNSLFETDAYFEVPIREYKDDEVNREDLAMGFRNRAYYEDNYEEEPNFQEIVAEARRRASIDVLAEERNIIVSNINAIEFKYKDNLSDIPDDEVIAYEVYIQKSDGKIFSIGAVIKLSKKEIYLPILNRIISSFKFIEK